MTDSVQLILLGTGTPNAEPHRAGSSLAVVVGDNAYLIDFGPGVVRRANAAARKGIKALRPSNLNLAFLTHLHTDHTLGYADLIFTPWVLERKTPLRVYGPTGLQVMTNHLLAAYQADIQQRLNGLEPANLSGYQVEVNEISAGFIFENNQIKIQAFAAQHGSWPTFGYRITTPKGIIVVSGDTSPHPDLLSYYRNCNILVHEVYSRTGFQQRPPEWQRYHAANHTSTIELAAIAAKIRPEKLVLYHQLFWGQSPDGLVQEIADAGYEGTVVSGKDLQVFAL